MIKHIKVTSSKVISDKNTLDEVVKFTNEIIAISTTAFENTVLGEGYGKFIKPNKEKVSTDSTMINATLKLDVFILDLEEIQDLIKALKHGDIVAKKRILKQLEEL